MALLSLTLDQITGFAGGMAASIAVGAFVGQVVPGLTGASEKALRRRTVIGGLGGLGLNLVVIVLSASWW